MNKPVKEHPDQDAPILQSSLEPGFFLFNGDMIPVEGLAAIGVGQVKEEKWGQISKWKAFALYRPGCAHGLEDWETDGTMACITAKRIRDIAICNYVRAREELDALDEVSLLRKEDDE